ncbi:kinase, putative [Ricinus communis]|uniref:Kinase, putative n=1 Tax=Ricinus communis TaxID=3988 RepID=B9SW65_RICCO|nr:kinase, putative [Ricinus communis]
MKELTEILAVVLGMMIMYSFQAYSQDPFNDLRIDCGASKSTPATDNDSVFWLPDDSYIKTGKNHLLTCSQNFRPLNILRYFPDGNKSCYNLPFYVSDKKFLFRAGFYYGNYDALLTPPIFNLETDGNLWAAVTTSMSEDEPIYHEMVYKINGDTSQVCLVRTSDDVPFISSLEAIYFLMDNLYHLYGLMENKTALLLHSRINYGANDSIGLVSLLPYIA